ncbi:MULTISPECIES: N-acetylglucosamine-6-phosphate deacetylase [unclassified Salinivibrio]|uniref:N-acetylglucosamine-6-phosphate deacetylase n=1 Tax=unclassified Salinivibrio TaxID=2636825 RepID=UPI000614971C|nr:MULTISPECIES: N-acetylglucosamine-6-phosphate deacetylase [unclassified Salinivibrio]KKA45388.1 N-acetylglucosamine-6-phosphate deacetylase [Salinivibrio sp. KP-1]OOE76455.1 N-acetylglucosamine-6-phosphate deacetylase [Salinivibrio sp. ML290]
MTEISIRAKKVLTDLGWIENSTVTAINGVITAIKACDEGAIGNNQFDVDRLVPAFIDTHVHGGAGVDVMDGHHDALNTLSTYLASQGVGAFLATTVTAPFEDIEAALKQVSNSYFQGVDGAELLGGYLEGPYFTPENKGAHPESLFRELDVSELCHWIDISNNTLKVVALAPEKKGAITAIQYLKSRGVNVMLGHSAADYEMTSSALEAGADGLVHCFNGMKGVHHREPGAVGAGLSHDSALLELIADGHHVHPAVMKVCCRCAPNRLVLISDAMRAAGMPDGPYLLGEMPVMMKNGVVRTESGGLAGSTLSLSQAVRTLVNEVGESLENAINMATITPAKLLGVADRLGSIAIGKSASFVSLTESLDVSATWVNGKQVWPN